MIFRLFPLCIVFIASRALARAGGAGGGGGSGGSGDGDIFGLIEILTDVVVFLLLRGPIGWAILAVLVWGVYFFFLRRTERQLPLPPRPLSLSLTEVDEVPAVLDQKVRKAFLFIQEGWTVQSTDRIRRFITDGVYQRFHAQFTMMKLLKQTNFISDVQIYGISFTKARREGVYDVVDVCLQAGATDRFVCETYPQLNSPGGFETFTEYWSFIRRTDHKKSASLYDKDNCPNCAAPLTAKLLESARCPYCSTYLNSGEYDWVLSEISQEHDYQRTVLIDVRGSPAIASPPEDVARVYPGFSNQALEDRASNALMQILIATATGNEQILKRITTLEGFSRIVAQKPPAPLLFDRLYLRAVNTLGVKTHGNFLRAVVAAEYNAHTIAPSQGVIRSDLADPSVSHTKVLLLRREFTEQIAKGSIYAGICPHCGAPQPGNLSPVCAFCSEVLNDPTLDWIVEDAISVRELRELLAAT